MATPNKLAYLNYEGLEKFWIKAKSYIDATAGASNKIEEIKVDGTALVINAKGINFGLDYKLHEGKHSICLVDNNNNGAVVDSFDASDFIKDGFLQNVSYDSSTKKISFTWNTDAGVTVTPVDLSGLVDVYTGNHGIKVTNNVIQHTNSVQASTTIIGAQTPGFGDKFKVIDVKYDAAGHITDRTVIEHTMPNSKATQTAKGLVKVGYTKNNKNYPVVLDSNDNAYVNVDWTDTKCVQAVINEAKGTDPTTDTVEVISEISDLTGNGTKLEGEATRVNVVTAQGLNKAIQGVQNTLSGHKSFSTVSVQGTSLAAQSVNDTLTIKQGSNVTLTASGKEFTISAQDTKCTEATVTLQSATDPTTDTVPVISGINKLTGNGTSLTGTAPTVKVVTAQGLNKAIGDLRIFKAIKVGSTTIEADTNADTLELVAGTNVTITPDATNDKITISSKDTNTAHGHTVGVGLAMTGNGGVDGSVQYKAKLKSETALSGNKIYNVGVNSDGQLAVQVPWENTAHEHTAGKGIELQGTAGIQGTQTITAKVATATERGAVQVDSVLTQVTDVIGTTTATNQASYHTAIDICSEKIYAKIPTITEDEIDELFK